jgi:cell wall assembly regulator SMI1
MHRTRRTVLTISTCFGAATIVAMLPASCWRPNGRTSRFVEKSSTTRPAGKPKPLIEEDIRPVIARLDTWFSTHLRSDRYRFNSAATNDELDAFEHTIGLKLPQGYRQLYTWHDGEDDDRWGHIFGLPLLPLKEAASQWKSWNGVLSELGGNRYTIPGGAWPDGAVDPAYVNPLWIPLTHDGSGNHIGIDFDPWPRGRVGQIILYGRDEDIKIVIAQSLGQFLEWIANLLESGNFRLGTEPGKSSLRQFRLRNPPADDFHTGARILLGAPGPLL